MSWLRCRRAVALAWALTLCIVKLVAMQAGGALTPERRALWLQWCCTNVIRSMGIGFRVEGTPPMRGLLVSNHLSYLDILIYSAAAPCVFVAKAEIAKWPYFGFAARQAGTLFIDRSSRASAQQVAQQMAQRLAIPVPILVFPEGTSSDGAQVMRFHSALFEPAVAAAAPVTAAAVRYGTEGGVQESDLCWYGDESFLPHMWRTLGAPGFTAEVRFAAPRTYADRRTAAFEAHEEVVQMRDQMQNQPRAEREAPVTTRDA